jgi:hypothetical protein
MSSDRPEISKEEVLRIVAEGRVAFDQLINLETYFKALTGIRDGLSLFVEDEVVRDFLDQVLFAEFQTAQHIVVEGGSV